MDILLFMLYFVFGAILFYNMYGSQKEFIDYEMTDLAALVVLFLFWPIALICLIVLAFFELW